MDVQTAMVVALVLGLLVLTTLRGGNLWQEGVRAGANNMLRLTPILVLSFLAAGLLEVLLPQQMLVRWLGSGAGLKGILAGCLIGALMPGPPYALYPLIVSFYKGGAGIGALVGLLTGKALWNVHHLPPALAVMGPGLTAAYFLSNLVFPPLAGWIAHSLASRFV
jgi:uncharacterized membrane protein YraQ (UPF0718 family)